MYLIFFLNFLNENYISRNNCYFYLSLSLFISPYPSLSPAKVYIFLTNLITSLVYTE